MFNQKQTTCFLLLTIFLITACTTDFQANNFQVSAPINEKTETEAESIHMNNCGGRANADQTAERTQAISIAGEAVIGVDYQILEGAVTAKYIKTDTTSKKQTLTAPPGTNMEFVLLWIEDVKSGVITVQGRSGQATYRVSTPIAVELASSQDLGCVGEVQQPVAPEISPSVTQPQQSATDRQSGLESFTQDDINALLGAGNWSCLPGWPNGISIENVTADLVVQYPLIFVDKDNVRYDVGQAVPGGGLATGWLQSDLPDNNCSTVQLQISQSDINALLGSGNWDCLAGSPSGVAVRNVPPDFAIQSPIIYVDKLDVRYSVGEVVPSGGPATVWLQGNLSSSQCP